MSRCRRLVLSTLLLCGLAALPSVAAAHGEAAPAPSFPAVLFAWRLDWLLLAALGVSAIAWLLLVRGVAVRHPAHRHPRWRTAAVLTGLATLALALLSPIEAYEGSLFSVHMLQHMVLELVAAPLLLLGAPATLALRAASPGVRRALLSILHSRLVAAVSFPLLAWIAFAAVNWGWHFSGLYNEALENPGLHDLQHLSFLLAALLFWWPVIGADPSRWRLPYPVRLFYLFLAMPQNSFLGVALMSAPQVLYPHYLSNLRTWGPSPLVDQNVGGMLMWVGGDVVFLLAMGLVVAAWVRQEDRRTRREDARLDAAAAAAAANRGET
jgi:putative copper resistance protein D